MIPLNSLQMSTPQYTCKHAVLYGALVATGTKPLKYKCKSRVSCQKGPIYHA